MTTAIVFIYQQQNCIYATIWAIFFYLFRYVRVDNRRKKIGGVTIFSYFLKLTFFYWLIFSKLVSTHTDSNEALLKVFGLLKVSLFFVIQLKSYEIETVHYMGYLFFETVKIAQISHWFTSSNDVYDIQVSQKSIFGMA